MCGSRCPGHLSPVSNFTLLCLWEAVWLPPSLGQRLQGHVLSAKSLRGFTHSFILEHAFPLLITFSASFWAANNALYYFHLQLELLLPLCLSLNFHSYIKKKKSRVPTGDSSFYGSQS